MPKRLSLIAALLLLLLSAQASAWTVITSTKFVSNGGSTNTSASIDTSGADLIIAVLGWFPNSTPVLTDNKTCQATWSTTTARAVSNVKVQVVYCWNAAAHVGLGHTFTATCVSCFFGVTIIAVSGSQTSADPLDATQNGATNASTASLQTGSAGANGNLAIAGLSTESANAKAIDSTFTIQEDQIWQNNVNESSTLAYKAETGADNPTFSWTGLTDAAATLVSFLASGGGGGPAGCKNGLLMQGVGCEDPP